MSSEQYLYCWIYYTCLFYFICSTCWGNTHRKNYFIWTCPPCKITKWKDLLKRHLFMSLKRFPQKDKLLVKLDRKVKRILFLLNTSPNSTIQTKLSYKKAVPNVALPMRPTDSQEACSAILTVQHTMWHNPIKNKVYMKLYRWYKWGGFNI